MNVGGYTVYSGLIPYVKNTQIFVCPSDRPPGQINWSSWGYNITTYTSYGLNWYYYLSPPYMDETFNGDDPARVAAMTEFDASYHTAYWPWMNNDGLFLHNGGQNVVFGDGHTKWYSRTDIISGFNSYGYKS